MPGDGAVAAGGSRRRGDEPAPELLSAGRWALAELPERLAGLAPLAAGEAALYSLHDSPEWPLPAGWGDCLDPSERVRAVRFLREADRRRFVLAHGMLRRILAGHTGLPAYALAFASNAHGKPGLRDGGLEFNLSHAGGCVLVAVSAAGPVGVDVEVVRELPDAADLMARFFAPEEGEAYRACPAYRRPEAFFAAWTRKEAYVKALGGGLAIPLDAFAVSLDQPARVLRPWTAAPRPGPRLLDLPVPAGYGGALAGRPDRVFWRELVFRAGE